MHAGQATEAGRGWSWTCCSPRGAQRLDSRRSSPPRRPASSDRSRDRIASGSPITPPRLWKVRPVTKPDIPGNHPPVAPS